MPIYEYQGQQYDIATDDPAAAKAKILNYLGSQEETPAATKKPVPKPAPKATEPEAEYDFGSPMGTGSEEIMAQPNKERRTYTGSVFDTQPFEPEFNPAEADRLSRRAYAEATTKPPRRTQYIQATPKEQLERTAGQTALDTTIGLLQGATAIPRGLASNINAGDNPIARFYESAIQAAEKAKSPYLQSQKAEREAFIKNVTQNQGELAGTRASFNTMFSPAGADIVSQGTGSIVPTLGMSLFGLGQRAMVAMNALSVAGEAAQNTAQKLSQMGPENWSNSSAYQELRSAGLSHRDAVNMLAPLFAMPNQALGLIIGGVSGSTGFEKTLAGKSITGGARERAARAGAELLGEEAETLIPSFAANVTQRIFDDKQSLVEGLGKEAVETAVGTVPGAALAASGRSGKKVKQPAVKYSAEDLARSKGFLVKPPTVQTTESTDLGELGTVRPSDDLKQPPPPPAPKTTPDAVREARVQEEYEKLLALGTPPDTAKTMAVRRVAAAIKAENKAAAVKVPEGRVEQITQDLIAAGVPPQQAKIDAQQLAQEEAEADEFAQTETGGAANVRQPVVTPSGESVSVAGQSDTEPPAGGAGVVDTGGVDVARQNAPSTAGGERTKPLTLEERLFPEDNKPPETKPAEATPEKETTLYHGTNTQYETLDPEKSGGMVFFGEDLSTAKRYAQNGGGGRARLSNTQKYIVDRNGVVYELDGETWKAVGVAPEEGLINQDTLQPLDKAYPSLSQAEAEEMTNPDSGTAGVVPKTSRIITQDFSGLKLLDISTPEGRNVIAGLTPSTQVGSGLIEAARFDAGDKTDPNSTTQLNSNFWSLTKYSSAYGEQLKKDIIAPLKAMGYDGIRFQDDQHSSVGLFDTGLGKTKPTKETPTETEGAELGTETIEAVEATQEGQEAPAAGVTKRGRKAAPAEVKEQKKLSRNEQNRINNDADYKLKKYTAQLEQTLTPEQIEELSLEEAEQAEIDARQSRRSALRGLLALQGNPNIARGSAVGKRISAALKASKATEAELADIRRGMKAAEEVLTGPKEDVLGGVATSGVSGKTEAKVSKSSDIKVGKADTGFSKLTNGSQAITHIIKTGNLFQRFVAQRIRNFVVGVKFVVVEKDDGTPAKILAELSGARGLFVYTPGSKERTVYVRGASFGNQQGINVITVLHELLHAATASRIEAGLLKGFRNASLQKFMREMESLMKKVENEYHQGVRRGTVPNEVQDLVETGAENVDFDSRGRPKFEIFNNPHEFLAYGMSSPEFQKFLMSVQGTRGTGFSGFVNSIRDLFGVKSSDSTAFTDLVDITDKMLGTRRTAVQTKGGSLQQKINYTPPEFDEDADKGEQKELRTAKELTKARIKAEVTYQQSADSQKVKDAGMLQKIRDPEKAKILLKAAWKKMNSAQRSATVKLPTWNALADMFKDELPHVGQAYELHNQMKGTAKAMLEAAEERIRVTRNAFDADKTLKDKFTRMVYETTDAQYDPSDTTLKVRDKEFDNRYKALGAKGQELYKMWRDYYVDMGDLFIELLDEQVRGISGLTDEVKSNLAAVIRQTYETKDRIKPFFPFVRDEGDYWLAVGKPNSANRAFYIYDSIADRDEDAARIAAEKRSSIEEMRDSGDMEMGDDLDAMRNTARDSSQLLTSIFAAIDAIKLPAGDTEGTTNAYKENLKDSVYQVFLNTMPEQSFRLMFRHRKGRGGYRTDFIQNAARTATKMSVQLARLKYAQKMRNVTSAARDSIVGREELLPVVQELERRVANVLSPKPYNNWDAIAGAANKITYLWTLTSASTALIQPMSVYISALPILAVNHGFAPIKVAKELGKMVTFLNQYGVLKENVDGTHRYVAPSIANAKNLPADEKRAIQAMTRLNVAQSTYVAQVYDYSQTPVSDLESIRGKGAEAAYLITGALMHNMERLTREAVYLASYRLGRQRGLSEADAIQQAANDTREALGDYETTNKPRWMQRGLGRVAFAMKMYPVIMIQQVFGNFLKMLPFFNKEGKKEALAKFTGIMMTAGSVGGLAALPAFSVLIHALVAALKDKVDEEDLPEELKDLDPEMWFREVYMPQKFGEFSVGGVPLDEWIMDGPINAITGWNVSSRIGLNDIWAKDGKSTKNVKEAAASFLAAYFGGPTLSVATSMLDAVEQYMLGDYEKGNEKMMPKPIRDILLAQKYDIEGIKSATGVELVAPENVKTSEKVGQVIGFAPALTAGVKEAGFKLLSNEQDILNERNKILRKLDIQNRKGTEKGDAKFDEIIDTDVETFNKRYPDYALKNKDIKKSLKTKEKQRQESPAGVTTTKKFYGIGDEAITNLEKKLERRETEMEERRKVDLKGMAEKNPR